MRLSWRANSRALAIERGSGNVGPISPHAIGALGQLGIQAASPKHPPTPCMAADLSAADLIIALEEKEHRPLLVERFPAWEKAVRYWHVRDIEFEAPIKALAMAAGSVDELLAELCSADEIGPESGHGRSQVLSGS
jgi:protein-tyrosine phosphatase